MRILSLLIFLLNPECHTFVFQSTLQILPGALVHSSLRIDTEREREGGASKGVSDRDTEKLFVKTSAKLFLI